LCCLLIYFLSVPVTAVDYDDFPTNLKEILDERIAAINSDGGICIAGRVALSDSAAINGGEDVKVNLLHHWDEPLWVYEGGWFIMGRIGPSSLAGPGADLILRAFGYDPIDASFTLLDGKITYVEFELMKTQNEKLASVIGTVYDENNQPFKGARVSISFPLSSHGTDTEPRMSITTGQNGQYLFEGLSITEHSVTAAATGYAYHYDKFTPPVGGTAVENRKLFPNRRIIIDYVYQVDGSSSFIEGNLQTGTIDWLNGEGGLDFSEGQVKCCGWGKDLNMEQQQDVLTFRNAYGCVGNNGFYDAGVVDFLSVAEASATGYSQNERPVLVGHVYVVRTCDEANYAKFIVKSGESSFRTVVPGDSDPIDFAGYGLTIDFSFCSDYGRVYVRKYSGMPIGIQKSALPYYWEITGMKDLTFLADLTITYNEDDVMTLDLSERDLTILQSPDNGGTWIQLETQRDLLNNTLHVEGINSLSWFAIASEHTNTHTLRADIDGNGIVDFGDFAIMVSEWLKTESWHTEYGYRYTF